METRKKIMELYEFDEEEREFNEQKRKADLRSKFMDEGDEKEKNKNFIELKIKLKKALYDLNEQEYVINSMKEKLTEHLGTDGFFIKWFIYLINIENIKSN